jgi:hypothetical protein
MEPDIPTELRIAVLTFEISTIHICNSLYFDRGAMVTLEQRTEHLRRQDRLEVIHAELAKLQSDRK